MYCSRPGRLEKVERNMPPWRCCRRPGARLEVLYACQCGRRRAPTAAQTAQQRAHDGRAGSLVRPTAVPLGSSQGRLEYMACARPSRRGDSTVLRIRWLACGLVRFSSFKKFVKGPAACPSLHSGTCTHSLYPHHVAVLAPRPVSWPSVSFPSVLSGWQLAQGTRATR
ncbi:hypothetical protein K505DRAFT_57166 [Melanomma pulvis-pyrius CBS 109.77]|uniref:Uncharacterized protein n=1 Tax=Melanomma pulvis-pyrius CBS 109.77 TaxID=1314802 RepID=A0A6A6X7C5_9PLEO|nr:hypothetical protein K505DRAFT_57166 [Melanomma pulvis-pyrius CBS 109.77]